jgi:beta-galactosidase
MKLHRTIMNLRMLIVGIVIAFAGVTGAQTTQRLVTGWEYYQGSMGSLWEIWRGNNATHNVTWTPVTLPHCFNARDAVDPDVAYYQGPGWYRTRLKVANPFPNGRTLLYFNGAGQKSQVFIGLKKVGEHLGGFDEWEVDITDAVAASESKSDIQLAVQCDNSRDAETIPSDLSDFNRYGGLYRHVSLVYVPAISIERMHIEPSLVGGKAAVKVRTWLRNPAQLAAKAEFVLEVRDPKGSVVHSSSQALEPWTGAREIAAFEIASPVHWSPKSPALYSCSVTIKSSAGEQKLADRFGLRSVEWVPYGPFKLNGERLALHGTHYHEDHAGVAAAVPDEVVRQTLRSMKEMGVNFVRLGHYQQAPLVLDLCDELGILAWEETPWCRGGVGGDRYQQQGRDMLRNMIYQHYNHPSIILWGLGNENDWPGDFPTFDTNGVRSFMTELNTLAHQLDPSRKTSIRRCNFAKDIPDVYSPSMWPGWYGGRYPAYRSTLLKAMEESPHLFHAEFGGDSHAGRHSEEPDKFLEQATSTAVGRARASDVGDWSESYIINLFDWYLKEQESLTNLTGAAQWIFKDFATPLRPENPVPRVNQKGVAGRDGKLKESYYLFQSYWSEKPMLHIYGHTWPVRWGKADEEKQVKVFSNCREVELFVNGVSAGVKQRNSTNFPAAGLCWWVKFDEGTNTLRAVAHTASGDLADEIMLQYQIAEWSDPARFTLRKIAETNNIFTVEARVYDNNGVPCLDAANLVRFGLTGDGRLLDNLGTATGSRVVQLANGRAQISLQMSGGKAVVSVSSEGLPTQFLAVSNKSAATIAKVAPKILIDLVKTDRGRILKAANAALKLPPVTITASPAKLSEGGPNDFYSNGDYWWPDPTKPNGLPYIQRDGETNPDNFTDHRNAVRDMRDAVSALAAGYKIAGDQRYAHKAAELLTVFFLDEKTRMNPNLQYAQAVPGRASGRGTGIIDTLHLIEVPRAIEAMEKSKAFTPELVSALKKWFSDYTDWMLTSKNGKEEAAAKNNHSVAFWLQVASFAKFTGDEAKLAECRRQFKEVFVPNQMAADGSFPLELKRTKPYGYSIFQLDCMAALCQLISTPQEDLWKYELPGGRGMRKAMAYLYPYLADKSKWPLKPDVNAWASWPARQPSLLFAGLAYDERPYLDLWKKLEADPSDAEVRRNIPITQPILWVDKTKARVEMLPDDSS